MKLWGGMVALLLSSTQALHAQQQDTLRVLFVGNSFTFFHNLPQVVSAMAASQGVPIVTRQSTVGGSNLEQHWKGERGTQTRQKIAEGNWDYVVFNNHSSSAIDTRESFMTYGAKFAKLVRQHGAAPVFMMTWAYKSNPGMQAAITEGYKTLAAQTNAHYVPCGPLFMEVLQARPELEMYFDDKHPSPNGTYLLGLAFFKYFTSLPTADIPHRITTFDKDGEKLYLLFTHVPDADFLQGVVDAYAYPTPKTARPMNSNISKRIFLVLGPAVFGLCQLLDRPAGMPPEAFQVAAATLWIAIWWISEAVPIAVTALLPVVLFPLTGAVDITTTTAPYGHKYIFLYIGGFMLAIAIERWNLHRRVALHIIALLGTNVRSIILGFMVATAFLSMWISNTATSVMMLPIGMAIASQFKASAGDNAGSAAFGKALMLAIAYSASIGGIATLIGTPPNLVLAGILEELYNVKISFFEWFKIGLPVSLVLLVLCWLFLTRVAFKFKGSQLPGGAQEIKRRLAELGPMGYEEKLVLAVFVGTALAWMFRSRISLAIPGIDDSVIAMVGGIALFMIPAKEKARPLIKWEEAVKLPWGILVLFGGGMALAKGFTVTGLAEWIASQMTQMQGLSLLLLLLAMVAIVNFLTEITSNLATTAMLLPVLAPMAFAFNMHPFIIMVPVTLAASCAFMLPVATPPNSVVFGSGYLKISDMARTGILMNVLSIFIIAMLAYTALPYAWDFDPQAFPEAFKALITSTQEN